MQFAFGCCRALSLQRSRHRPFSTPGQHHPVVGFARLEPAIEAGHAHAGGALLPRQLRFADHSGQRGIADGISGEDQEMATVGVGLARGDVELVDGELGTEHRRQTNISGCFSKPNHTIETIVIGHRQRLQVEPGRFLHQLFWRRGPVEETEAGVAVELGVALLAWGADQCRCFVGLALAGPRRAVAAVCPLWPTRVRSRCVRECLFDGAPRHWWIPKPHRDTVPNTCSIAPPPPFPLFCHESLSDLSAIRD